VFANASQRLVDDSFCVIASIFIFYRCRIEDTLKASGIKMAERKQTG